MKADVSVVITRFNKPVNQLMECIESIKEQTVAPKEIILVDDCSDEPHAHAAAISVVLPKNVGVAKARDVGVRLSTGRLLLFVDADDKLAPDYIQQCGRVIAKCDIAYPNMLLFGDVPRPRLIDNPSKVSPSYLLGRKTTIPVTSMMHRYVYDKLGGFKTLPVFEDWDFWIRAMYNGYTFKKANTLLWYRQNLHSRNHSTQEIKNTIHYQITAPYLIKEGRLLRKPDGKQKT